MTCGACAIHMIDCSFSRLTVRQRLRALLGPSPVAASLSTDSLLVLEPLEAARLEAAEVEELHHVPLAPVLLLPLPSPDCAGS